MTHEAVYGGYVPGAIGRVAEMHARYYHRDWGFGVFFEAKVATELSEFLLRYDPERDGFWTALVNDRVEGSITIDSLHAGSKGAHLRWFILSSALRGTGVGSRLMEKAVSFCRGQDYARVYLWTFEGLEPARHLYEKFGFTLAEQRQGTQWGMKVNEQMYVLESG